MPLRPSTGAIPAKNQWVARARRSMGPFGWVDRSSAAQRGPGFRTRLAHPGDEDAVLPDANPPPTRRSRRGGRLPRDRTRSPSVDRRAPRLDVATPPTGRQADDARATAEVGMVRTTSARTLVTGCTVRSGGRISPPQHVLYALRTFVRKAHRTVCPRSRQRDGANERSGATGPNTPLTTGTNSCLKACGRGSQSPGATGRTRAARTEERTTTGSKGRTRSPTRSSSRSRAAWGHRPASGRSRRPERH